MVREHKSVAAGYPRGSMATPARLSAAVLGVVLVGCGWAARAHEIDPVNGKHGSFVVGIGQKVGGANLDAASRQSALAVADKVLAVVRRDPAIASPVGYSVRVNPVFGKRTDWADFDSGLPFYAGVVGSFFAADEKPSPTAFKGPDFGVYVNTALQCPVNTFTHPLSKHPWMLDGKFPVIEGGRATGAFRGYTIYDSQCVVLSRKKEPPFVSLTREQYVRLEIESLKERVEITRQNLAGQTNPALRSAGDSALQHIAAAITERQQELDAMDASTRGAPAFVQTGYSEAKLVDSGDDGAIPLSVPNPAFFDHSLPSATVQAIAVYVPFLQSGPQPEGLPAGLPDDWRPAMEKIRDQLDWAGLTALLQ